MNTECRFEDTKTLRIVEEVGHGSSPWVMDPDGAIHELHPTGFGNYFAHLTFFWYTQQFFVF